MKIWQQKSCDTCQYYNVTISRVPDQRFWPIWVNGITHSYIIYHSKEENKSHRNFDVVVINYGHVFLSLGLKVKTSNFPKT